jgi:hypothetical protein
MSNILTVSLDGAEVASATVSSIDNLAALLVNDPRYGFVTTVVPGEPIVMPGSNSETPFMSLPTTKIVPVATPLDAIKAWFKETFAAKIAEADTAAYMRAKAAASVHVTQVVTTIS